jgi:hypothetical protein
MRDKKNPGVASLTRATVALTSNGSAIASRARRHRMARTSRDERFTMAINNDKIDDTALALLYLTLHDGYRAWKGFDWDVLGRLHERG